MKRDADILAGLGIEVRRLRQSLGVSQEELAERAGLHRNYINGIERGKRDPGLTALFALAKGLQIHPARLLENLSKSED